jgi:AcrR family transcriptional regulator
MQVHDDTATGTPDGIATDAPDDAVTDGRRARRDRGRSAVCEAMIDLVFEGRQPPTTEQIAERAGVSVASLFRYFDTLDDLRRVTTELYFDRFASLFEIVDIGAGSRDQRIERFVDARATLYETTEPMCRLVRIRAHESPAVSNMIDLVIASRADQIRDHFAPELALVTTAAADDLTAVISTLTSFESWDQMCHQHRRTHRQVRRAWATALARVLPSDPITPAHVTPSDPTTSGVTP